MRVQGVIDQAGDLPELLCGLGGATFVNHVALEDGGGTAHLDGLRVVLQDRAPLDARVDLPLSALALGQLGD